MLSPFATQTKSSLIGGQGERLVNYFFRPAQGVTPGECRGCSGFTAQSDVGAEIVAEISFKGLLHVVAGGKLYSVSGSTVTEIGAVASGAAQMARSNSKLAIVAGGRYFVYDGSTISEHDTGQVVTPKGVVFINATFLVFGEDPSGRGDAISYSGANDAETFNGLDFVYAESDPDPIVAAIVDHSEIWFLGERTVEVWFNTGAADAPFQRNDGAAIEHGCADARTVAKEDNAVFWLSEDQTVFRGSGGAPQVISTPELEEDLRTSEVLGAFTFKDRGHKFYALRTTAKTHCFDMRTGLWSERAKGGSFEPSTLRGSVQIGQTQYLTTTEGKVGVLDPAVFDEDGVRMVAMAQSQPLAAGGRFSPSNFKAYFDTGLYAGDDPEAVLQTSPNGRDWSREKSRRIGGQGQYGTFARWGSLGQFRRYQFRLKISDAVQRDILGVTYGE
jgi:hypothetical protein